MAAAGGGQLVSGGQDLLGLVAGGNAATALARYAGQAATATGESPYQVQEGDILDFEGTVAAHDEAFAGEVGVDEANGAAQLTEQRHHLEVATAAVQLSE